MSEEKWTEKDVVEAIEYFLNKEEFSRELRRQLVISTIEVFVVYREKFREQDEVKKSG